MSLRSVFAMMSSAAAPEAAEAGDTGLFFVLNRDFLRPFHVLVYSLLRTRSLLDLPVVVISEDAHVAEDPVVAAVADRFVAAGPEAIAQFAKIPDSRVEPGLRLDWIAKYTFLKWLVFDDFGFRRHVYLDADILCLNPCNELAGLAGSDFYAAPVFDRKLTRDKEGWMLPMDRRERRMRAFLKQESWDGLNSGVMVINERLLDGGFRSRLIEMAEAQPVPVEQLVVRRLLRGKDYSQTLVSPFFNFNHGFLAAMTVRYQMQLLHRTKLLHFVGGLKPWNADAAAGEEGVWIGDALWRAYAEEACRALPLFEEARQRLDSA